MKSKIEKATLCLNLVLTLIFSVYFQERLLSQCRGINVSQSNVQMSALPSGCNSLFSDSTWKYRLQRFYVPKPNDPVITLKVVVHVFMPSTPGPGDWNNGTGQYNGLAALQNLFNQFATGNATGGRFERYPSPIQASYFVPGFSPQYISDSKIQYEVVKYYFYTNNNLRYCTANGARYDEALYLDPPLNTIPNLNYNPRSPVLGLGGAIDYIDQNYPERLLEGLPITLQDDGQQAGSFFLPSDGSYIPAMTIPQAPGNDLASELDNNRFAITQLNHEIGHCFGLLHTYYAGNCYPGTASSAPETPEPGTGKKLDCDHIDYLSDVFPPNNPNAVANSFPYPATCKNPPLNSCGSCYEAGELALGNTVYTNNMMSENHWNNLTNQAVYGWLSPLQMGRRIRSMHFLSNAFSIDGICDWGSLRRYAKEARSEHVYPLNITTNETWEFDIQMYKDILVRTGNTLVIKCKVAMATDGRIIVEKGAKLIIDGGEVTGWCKKTPNFSFYNIPLWFGVEVRGTWNQNQLINSQTGYSQHQGIIEIKNGGTISYAYKGVYMGYASNSQLYVSGSSGGIIIANDANFINNVNDVLLFQGQTGPVRSKLINCKFLTTGPIGEDGNGNLIQPSEHVKLYLNNGIYFENCTFENTSTVYTNFAKGIGISSTDSHFNVGFNISVGSTPSTKCVFKNLSVGIWIDNTNPLYTANIKNSDFTGSHYRSIIAENIHNLVVSENTFTISQSQVGIYLNQAKYYKIKNNSLKSLTSFNGTGIAAYSSGNGAHEIYRNNFSRLYYSIIAMDNNGGIGAPGLKMNCNDFVPLVYSGDNQWDIAITKTLAAMPTIDPNQGVLGNATSLVRNIYHAKYINSNVRNKFFVDPSNTQVIQHACNSNNSTKPNHPYNQSSTQVNVIPSNIALDYAADCKADPLSGGGNDGDRQRLTNLNDYITTLRESNQDGTNNFEIQSAVNSKLNIFLMDTLEGSQDSVITILEDNQGGMEDADIQLIFAYLKNKDYSNATIAKNNLPASRENWASLFSKIISIEQDDLRAMSIVDDQNTATFLTTYASNPTGDGHATAQAYLKFALGITHDLPMAYPDEDYSVSRLMQADQNPIVTPLINDAAVKLYPNPTKTGINFFYENEGEGILCIQVKDLLGKVILTNFIKKQHEEYISLSGLSNGVYILTVTGANKELLYQSKLVKQE